MCIKEREKEPLASQVIHGCLPSSVGSHHLLIVGSYRIFLFQSEGEDELKKRQLMELAIINGTYRDSQSKNSSRKC